MNGSLIRVFWSLLIHLAWLAVGIGILYLAGGSETSLNEVTRSQYSDSPAVLDDIRGEAQWQLVYWLSLALSVSWVLSGIWLLIADRQRPRTPLEGGSKRGLWVILLIATLFIMAFIGWSRVWRTAIQVDLAAGMLAAGVLTVSLSVFFAYFTSTGISVKPVMRPSVPFSNLLPSARGKA